MILLSISITEIQDIKIRCIYNSIPGVLDTNNVIVTALFSVCNFKRWNREPAKMYCSRRQFLAVASRKLYMSPRTADLQCMYVWSLSTCETMRTQLLCFWKCVNKVLATGVYVQLSSNCSNCYANFASPGAVVFSSVMPLLLANKLCDHIIGSSRTVCK